MQQTDLPGQPGTREGERRRRESDPKVLSVEERDTAEASADDAG